MQDFSSLATSFIETSGAVNFSVARTQKSALHFIRFRSSRRRRLPFRTPHSSLDAQGKRSHGRARASRPRRRIRRTLDALAVSDDARRAIAPDLEVMRLLLEEVDAAV